MRNRTIRSVLARRPMFANGGMLPPVTQSPMASGILGSSTPLIETVNNQQSPDSGVRVSMANGGIARLQGGGVPSLSIRPLPPGPGTYGSGAGPYERTSETLSNIADTDLRKRMERMFPEFRNVGGRTYEQSFGEGPNQGSRSERGRHWLTSGIREGVSDLGSTLGAVKDYVFDESARAKGYSILQLRAIDEMKQRRPDLAADIDEISEKIIVEGGIDIAGEELAQAVSYALSQKHENLSDIQAMELDYKGVEKDPQTIIEASSGPFAEIKAKYPEMPDDIVNEIRVQMESNPGTAIEEIVEMNFPGAFGEAAAPGAIDEAQGELMDVEVTEGEDGPPSQLAKGEDGPPSQLAKVVPTEKPSSPVPEAGEQPEVSQAKMVGAAFNKKEKIPEAKKELKDFVQTFKDAAPGYQGMTNFEKGSLIAEAGLRVMAGQSTNAIVNIAEGLKGLPTEFAKDKKAKRAFDQQVNLSAASYGLAAMEKQQARFDAFEKERRGLKFFAVKEDFTDPDTGREYKTGSLYQMTIGDLQDGKFGRMSGLLTSEKMFDTLLTQKLKDAKLLGPLMINSGKGSPTVGQLSKDMEKYTEAINSAEVGAKMKSLVDASILSNAKGQVTGLSNYGKRKINSLLNSVSYKKAHGDMLSTLSKEGVDSKEYLYRQQVIANMMLKEILGEGSKNVSNIDRELAQGIVGMLTEWDTIFASPEMLHTKLQHIRGVVDRGFRKNMNQMKDIEYVWDNIANRRGDPVRSRLGEKRKGMAAEISKIGGLSGVQEARTEGMTAPLRIYDFFDRKTGRLLKPIPRA